MFPQVHLRAPHFLRVVGLYRYKINKNMIPQLIYLAFMFLSLGIALSEHGKEKTGKHNFWLSLIAVSIILYVLYKGHFFDVLIN